MGCLDRQQAQSLFLTLIEKLYDVHFISLPVSSRTDTSTIFLNCGSSSELVRQGLFVFSMSSKTIDLEVILACLMFYHFYSTCLSILFVIFSIGKYDCSQ